MEPNPETIEAQSDPAVGGAVTAASRFNAFGRPIRRVRAVDIARRRLLERSAQLLLIVQLVFGGFLGFGVLLYGSHFGGGGATAGDGGGSSLWLYPARTIVTLAVIAVTLILGARPRFTLGRLFLLLYAAVNVVSAYWSIDPGGTLRAGLDFLLVLVSLSCLSASMTSTQFVNALTNTLALVVILSVVLALGFPQYGKAGLEGSWSNDQIGAWRGCFSDKNGLGGTAAVATAVMLIYWSRWRLLLPLKAFALVCAAACFVFAKSSNGIVGLVAIGAIFLLFRGRPGQIRVVVTWAVIFAVAFLIATSPIVPMIADALGRDATLNGRTPIWTDSLEVWQRSWVHGFGYIQGTQLVLQPELMTKLGISARHAHNGYIEVLVDTGVVGLLPMLAALLMAVIRAAQVPRDAPKSMMRASMALLVTVAGSMAMAGGDVTAFRLVGGWGVITWAAIVAIADLPRRYARPVRAGATAEAAEGA